MAKISKATTISLSLEDCKELIERLLDFDKIYVTDLLSNHFDISPHDFGELLSINVNDDNEFVIMCFADERDN